MHARSQFPRTVFIQSVVNFGMHSTFPRNSCHSLIDASVTQDLFFFSFLKAYDEANHLVKTVVKTLNGSRKKIGEEKGFLMSSPHT